MLVDFTVKNFRSIRDAMTLSLAKGHGDELEDTNVFDPQARATPKLVRGAAIYGPNASGKSNLVKAMSVMRQIIVEFSGKGDIEGGLPVTPFLLDETSAREPTEFEATLDGHLSNFVQSTLAVRSEDRCPYINNKVMFKCDKAYI